MIWKDFNGNEHNASKYAPLKLQQPECKFLLPCGLCTLHSDLKTCRLLLKVGNEND